MKLIMKKRRTSLDTTDINEPSSFGKADHGYQFLDMAARDHFLMAKELTCEGSLGSFAKPNHQRCSPKADSPSIRER